MVLQSSSKYTSYDFVHCIVFISKQFLKSSFEIAFSYFIVFSLTLSNIVFTNVSTVILALRKNGYFTELKSELHRRLTNMNDAVFCQKKTKKNHWTGGEEWTVKVFKLVEILSRWFPSFPHIPSPVLSVNDFLSRLSMCVQIPSGVLFVEGFQKQK